MTKTTKAFLFDLGNVLVKIDFDKTFEAWAQFSGVPMFTIKSRFNFDGAYKGFERGSISASEFFQSLRTSLDIQLSDEQFLKGWNALLGDPIPHTIPLLERAASYAPLYLFSNTNAAHYESFKNRYAALFKDFTKIFLSFEVGKRKPDAAAFRAVASDIGLEPCYILFFDDLKENVIGAKDIDMQAMHVKSIEDIRAAINRLIP